MLVLKDVTFAVLYTEPPPPPGCITPAILASLKWGRAGWTAPLDGTSQGRSGLKNCPSCAQLGNIPHWCTGSGTTQWPAPTFALARNLGTNHIPAMGQNAQPLSYVPIPLFLSNCVTYGLDMQPETNWPDKPQTTYPLMAHPHGGGGAILKDPPTHSKPPPPPVGYLQH